MMAGIVVVEAKGTCKDNTHVTGQGSGDSPATATTKVNQQITVQCAARGGVKSFDSARIIRDTRGDANLSDKC